MASKLQKKQQNEGFNVLRVASTILIVTGAGVLILTFWPVAKEEIKYSLDQTAHIKYVVGTEQLDTFEKPLTPPNTDFSIIIPKIGAVAPVIADVDPSDPQNYLPALKKGVAQAAGTTLPYDEGNLYLFAHSTDAFWNVNTYNAVFYLIGKLSNGDEIDIFYRGKQYKYQVYDKKVVEPQAIQYFGPLIPGERTLTLQTCYPPGTTLKRLIVLAKQVGS